MHDKNQTTLECQFHINGTGTFDSSHIQNLQIACADLHHAAWYVTYIAIVATNIAGIIAWVNVTRSNNRNRFIAKKKSTIDLIILEQTNQYLMEQRSTFLDVREEGDIVKLLYIMDDVKKDNKDNCPKTELEKNEEVRKESLRAETSKKIKSIATIINKYEMLAIGIEEESLCEDIYKKWLKSTLISDWRELSTFVGELRRKNNNYHLYERFENLATKWRLEPTTDPEERPKNKFSLFNYLNPRR